LEPPLLHAYCACDHEPVCISNLQRLTSWVLNMLDQFACLPALQQWACHALHAHAGSSQHTAMQPGACISPPVCIHATSFPLHLSCCCCILQEGWRLSQGSQELQLQELQVLEAVSSPSTNGIQTTWLLHMHVLVTTTACSCALPPGLCMPQSPQAQAQLHSSCTTPKDFSASHSS
jgi:hypothetical protein